MGSLLLQPAALHLSFKVTWADGSLRKPDLLLGPRTDNWGQGTFTPSVLRLYRRAVSVADYLRFPVPGVWYPRFLFRALPREVTAQVCLQTMQRDICQ